MLKMYLFTCNHHQNILRLMLYLSESCFISITSPENIRKRHVLWCWPLFKRKTNTDTNLDKDSSKHVKYSLAFSSKRKIVNLLQLHRDTPILKLNRIHQLHQNKNILRMSGYNQNLAKPLEKIFSGSYKAGLTEKILYLLHWNILG